MHVVFLHFALCKSVMQGCKVAVRCMDGRQYCTASLWVRTTSFAFPGPQVPLNSHFLKKRTLSLSIEIIASSAPPPAESAQPPRAFSGPQVPLKWRSLVYYYTSFSQSVFLTFSGGSNIPKTMSLSMFPCCFSTYYTSYAWNTFVILYSKKAQYPSLSSRAPKLYFLLQEISSPFVFTTKNRIHYLTFALNF